ncbi:GBS Bsp-like repeat-containing protein, partial [Streptococcus anginosus]
MCKQEIGKIFKILYKNALQNRREVKVPTWSNVNGQDDIIWYTAAKQA